MEKGLRPTYLGDGKLVRCCSSLSPLLFLHSAHCYLSPAPHLKQEPKERNERKEERETENEK